LSSELQKDVKAYPENLLLKASTL